MAGAAGAGESARQHFAARSALADQPALLIKLAPDLEAGMIAQICTPLPSAARRLRRRQYHARPRGVRPGRAPPGGLSGQPLVARARALYRKVYRATGGRLPIIGVGGIFSAEDAWGHLRAGASLVEIYTGLIYEGPGLPSAIKQGLMDLMRRDGQLDQAGHRQVGEVSFSLPKMK